MALRFIILLGTFSLFWAALAETTNEYCESNKCKIQLNVETKSGPVQGHIIDRSPKRKVVAFYGIPFAEPPTGSLRFRPPKPVTPWTEPIKNTEFTKKCPQHNLPFLFGIQTTESSDDCLKLNIWVPEDVPNDSAVMVYIHGGAFIAGAPLDSFTDGFNLAAQENIIVVTIAYRVDSLGFLYLGIDEAPGNVGLLDQQLALKWVKENIVAFGGCPDRITIFGVSAGGASVGYQLLSDGSKGLFNRAIMISGAPTNPWAYRDQKTALESAETLAKGLGFKGDIENKKEILDFLTNQDMETFEKYEAPEFPLLLSPKLFGPTTDKTFLPISPREAVEKGRFHSNIDLMIGATTDEASMFVGMVFPELFKEENFRFTKEDFHRVNKERTLRNFDDDFTRILNKFYTDPSNPDDPEKLLFLSLDAVGDSLFVIDIEHFGNSYQKSGRRVFKYVFDQIVVQMPSKWTKSFHGSEQMITLANIPQLPLAEDIKQFGKEIMRRWANFARTGEPNLEGGDISTQSPRWPEYQQLEGEYLILKAGNYTIGKHYRARESAMWYHLLKLSDL